MLKIFFIYGKMIVCEFKIRGVFLKNNKNNEKALRKILEVLKKSYKKNKVATIIVVAILVVALVVGFVIMNSKGNDEKSDKGEKETTTTTTTTVVTTTVVTTKKEETTTTTAKKEEVTTTTTVVTTTEKADEEIEIVYNFRYEDYLNDHFKKHKADTGCQTVEEYLARANYVIFNPDSLMGDEKSDGEDSGGDLVYYLEETNEIVFLSSDGYIRTYFKPTRGIDYFYDNVA